MIMRKATAKNTFQSTTEVKKRVSNRIYPQRRCLKPDCQVLFTPRYKQQTHCCDQHRIDRNNDARTTKDLPGKMLEKTFQHNQRVLKKLYAACIRLNTTSIPYDYLSIEEYNHECFTNRTINEVTRVHVYWCYHYGIERIKDTRNFIIHYRENL